jgi:outer membrane protein OmpA-like peptidoglycan-associated protein
VLDTRTKQGAVAGGLLGAITGAAIAKHNNARGGGGAAIGAVAGALAGGLIGRYLDQQARDLDAIPGAQVEKRSDSLRVDFSSELLFDSGSAQLEPGAYERLRSLARTLNNYPESRVTVRGHTDNSGEERTNQRLSEERADRVRSFVVSEGVAAGRITAVGFGSSMPVASNATATGRAQNRRVEVEIRPDSDAGESSAG